MTASLSNKHILVVASTFPAHDHDTVPAFVRDQINAMKAADPTIRFSVLAPHDSRSDTNSFTQHPAFDEYRFHYLWPASFESISGQGGIMPSLKANPLKYLLLPFLFAGECIALYRLARKLRPNVIYAHWFTPQGVMASWVGRALGIPFVFTTHAADVDVWHKIPLVGRYIVRWNASRAQAITAVSTRSMAKLQRFFTDAQWQKLAPRTKIIPMGVDLPDLPSNQSPRESSHHRVLFLGRLAEKKGVTYLLRAFETIGRPDAQLIIAGDGPLRHELEQEVLARRLTHTVSFVGYVSGIKKQQLLDLADIFVVPSIITKLGDAEGLPVALLEALAAGKICIATHESGADDIITNHKNGYLIPQKDSEALASSLREALALPIDERQQLQLNARELAQHFAWPQIAQQHLTFFASQLDKTD